MDQLASSINARSNMTPEEYMVGTQQCVPATNQHLDGLDDWILDVNFQLDSKDPWNLYEIIGTPWLMGPEKIRHLPIENRAFDHVFVVWERYWIPEMFSTVVFWVEYHPQYVSGWWFQTCFIFHFIYGMSSFPLTHSYFSRWLKPPTRYFAEKS